MKLNAVVPSRRTTGAVFTRPEVVTYMMRETRRAGGFRKWSGLRVLEPSCGDGAFVLPLVDALVAESPDWNDSSLNDFLCAFDISEESVSRVRNAVDAKLSAAGCPKAVRERLLSRWFLCEDFLLYDFTEKFDVIIGNPPYIRFDNLDAAKQSAYKSRYCTFSERCDIYVPFFERSMSLLSKRGVLSFICSNRFVRSSYGRRLRKMIGDSFHVALYLNMEHTQPFETEVSAYPAIFVLDRRMGRETYSGEISTLDDGVLERYRTGIAKSCLSKFDHWYGDGAAWVTTDCTVRSMMDNVASSFPTIEESGAGTRIGIGVASGADDIYVAPQLSVEVESDCLLPLVASEDIRDGRIEWNKRYMFNPYDNQDDRQMLNLERFPRASAYLNRHAEKLKSRYCAKKHPDTWYRTLDRIKYSTLRAPKLLLPDIQRGGNVALDERGEYYPHHNVYWITSASWDMKALCVIMRSSFVTNQMRCVSMQMRGGSIRYQSQNLRNIHIPAWSSLDERDVSTLATLYSEKDIKKIDACVERVVAKASFRQPPRISEQSFDFGSAVM